MKEQPEAYKFNRTPFHCRSIFEQDALVGVLDWFATENEILDKLEKRKAIFEFQEGLEVLRTKLGYHFRRERIVTVPFRVLASIPVEEVSDGLGVRKETLQAAISFLAKMEGAGDAGR
ncbi:MAG: hypothetical protein QXZ06_08435 [Candidatus Jordarchaeales archaeon]